VSRAFIKDKDDDAGDDLPERPESGQPNYVTSEGLAELRQQLAAALDEQRRLAAARDEIASKAALSRLSRDIKYLRRRIDDAIVVESNGDEIGVGTTVTIHDGEREQTYTIVGEDQADPLAGRISWTSPLATALMGKRRGERTVWERPLGDVAVTIVAVRV
jgi:transcription elongation factor GreB